MKMKLGQPTLYEEPAVRMSLSLDKKVFEWLDNTSEPGMRSRRINEILRKEMERCLNEEFQGG